MKAVEQLENLGFLFRIEGDNIKFVHIGTKPEPSLIRPLLAEIKMNKSEALSFLQERSFTNETKQRVVFPANSDIPFPSSSWQRLEDGRIEALLCFQDLKTMIYWRDFILADRDV